MTGRAGAAASREKRRWNIEIGGYDVKITISKEYRLVIERWVMGDPHGATHDKFTCTPIDAANFALALQQASAIAAAGWAKAIKANVTSGLSRVADMVINATKGGR